MPDEPFNPNSILDSITLDTASEPESSSFDPSSILDQIELDNDPGFFTQAAESALNTLDRNITGDLSNDIDLGPEGTGFSDQLAQGVGEFAGSTSTVLGASATGAAIGSAFGGVGAAPGAAVGGVIGASVDTIQGTKREINSVVEQIARSGGTMQQARNAAYKAIPGTLVGEFTDLLPLGGLVPKRFRRNLFGELTDEAVEAGSKGLDLLGRAKNALFASAGEGAGEIIQETSQTAAVESELTDSSFTESFADNVTSEESLTAGAIGAIIGGGGRVAIDTGVEVASKIAEPQTMDATDKAALEITQQIIDLQDPETESKGAVIANNKATKEQLQEITKDEPDLEVVDINESESLIRKVDGAEDFGTIPSDNTRPVLNADNNPQDTNEPLVSTGGALSLDSVAQPRFSEKVREDTSISQELRNRFGGDGEWSDIYFKTTNKETLTAANKALEDLGLEGAVRLATAKENEANLSTRERLGVLLAATHNVDEKIVAAEEAGDLETAKRLGTLAEDAAFSASAILTDSAQTLQAGTLWRQLRGDSFINVVNRLANNVAQKHGFDARELSPETTDKLRGIHEKMKEVDSGRLNQELTREMVAVISKDQTKIDKLGLVTEYWMSNILSGVGTQAVNIAGNGANLAALTASKGIVESARDGNFRQLRAIVKGVTSSQKQAIASAREAFSGKDIGRTLEKIRAPRGFEQIVNRTEGQPGVANRAANLGAKAMQIPFRMLGAGDAYFFNVAREAEAFSIAAEIANRELGKDTTSAEFARAINKQLFGVEERIQQLSKKADSQVKTFLGDKFESVSNSEKARLKAIQLHDLISEERSSDIQQQSSEFAARATFTQKPSGSIGRITNAINALRADLPQSKFIFPFTNVVSNVVDNGIDFTVWGAVRAALGRSSVLAGQKDLTDRQAREKLGKAIVGTGLTTAITALAISEADEEEPLFTLHGAGPTDFNKRRQLMSQGWVPWSIQTPVGFFKFDETPLAIPMAMAGKLSDAVRDKDVNLLDVEHLAQLASLTGSASLQVVVENTYLEGVGELFENISRAKGFDEDADLSDALSSGVGKTLKDIGPGLIPLSGALKDIATAMDPVLKDRATLSGLMLRNVPFAKSNVKPMLNALGEPIEISKLNTIPGVKRFFSLPKASSEDWKFLGEKGLFISGDSRTIGLNVSPTVKATEQALGKDAASNIKNKREFGKALTAEVQRIREEDGSRIAADMMTEDEKREYVIRKGGRIKSIISDLREEISSGTIEDDSEVLQAEFNKRVRDAKAATKIEMMAEIFEVGEINLSENK